jgi:hypothetical protein
MLVKFSKKFGLIFYMPLLFLNFISSNFLIFKKMLMEIRKQVEV